MNTTKNFFLIVILIGSISVSWADGDNKSQLDCVAITDQCGVCSDESLRKPPVKNQPWKDSHFLDNKLSPYQCASQGKVIHGDSLAIENCIKLSDFCAICKDGSYLFTKDKQKIDSDLYECATSPRHSRGKVN